VRRFGSLWSEAGTVLAGNVLARGLGFLFPLVLARVIAKDDFGTVYFFIGTGYFVGELTGFPTALTRFIAAEGPSGAWLSSALAGGAPLIALSLVIGELLSTEANAPAGHMSMVIAGLTLDAYYFALLRGLKRYKLLASYRVSANGAQIVLLLGAIVLGVKSPTVAIAIYSFVYIVPIVAIELLRHPLHDALRGTLRPNLDRVKRLTRFALPAFLSGTAAAGLTQADLLFVRLLAPDALPDYAAARSLVQPVMLVPYAIAIVMLPAVASAPERERWRLLTRALGVTALLGTALVAIYVAADAWLVDTILPASYHDATKALPLLAAGLTGMGVYSVLSQWWMGIGRPGPPAVVLTLGALVAIGMQYALTPSHGAVGAALALGCGVAFALVTLGAATLRMRVRARRAAPALAGSA
jgi:O-antigen/teichoic acid export membrane protein